MIELDECLEMLMGHEFIAFQRFHLRDRSDSYMIPDEPTDLPERVLAERKHFRYVFTEDGVPLGFMVVVVDIPIRIIRIGRIFSDIMKECRPREIRIVGFHMIQVSDREKSMLPRISFKVHRLSSWGAGKIVDLREEYPEEPDILELFETQDVRLI